jgi:asparagine synthetase B (glutamine-hydrolysing)
VFKVAAKIPLDQKITKETTKYALRQALRQIVPAHVLNRRKLGFPVPIRHWLRDEMYDWARQIARTPCCGCWRSTARARWTTRGGSGRCWCTCSGTGSSWSGASSRGSPSRSTR